MTRMRIEHPAELASLPADDPLRVALAGEAIGSALADAIARADAEEPVLRAALTDVPIPAHEDRLLAIPRRSRLVPVGLFAVAATIALAFAIGLVVGRSSVESESPVAPLPSVAPAPLVAARTAAPDVVAIKVWHPSCPACKSLDPRYATVVDAFDDGSVLFMTFDLSTDTSRRQAELLVAALGVHELFDDPLPFLGSVVLIDAETKARIGQVTAKQDEEEMKGSIRDAIARSRS
jgi:thiol-disulfide isomerase/thioredoxin